MAKIVWDATGERYYESGVDHGVLYPLGSAGRYETGVAWNGLINVTESPEGAEPSDMWADNIKYGSLRSAETFGGTIEAYTYPEEFEECDGNKMVKDGVYIGQQSRKSFGFSYRTKIGNDVNQDLGYKLHLVYGCTASPSEKSRDTINDSPEAATLSWEFDTTPVNVTGGDPTATIVVDSRTADPTALANLEKKLYGDSSTGTPTLPSPDEVIAMFNEEA